MSYPAELNILYFVKVSATSMINNSITGYGQQASATKAISISSICRGA
jgi:hypothetical protein